jgi:multicomponent Na+:H+ antiporter subunit G
VIVVDWLVALLIITGASLALVAALGLQQFPDVFARMHAATKPATLGLLLIASGTAMHLADPASVAKLGIVVILQFVTAPVAAHMIGRAAYRTGTELSPATVVDELAGVDLNAAPPGSPREPAAPPRPGDEPDLDR